MADKYALPWVASDYLDMATYKNLSTLGILNDRGEIVCGYELEASEAKKLCELVNARPALAELLGEIKLAYGNMAFVTISKLITLVLAKGEA